MLERIFAELGPWNWMVLGLVLLTLEILAPGVFLLWIGIAALLVGAASLALWSAAFWVWQVQVVAFLILALISAYLGKRIMAGRGNDSDQPLLNRRGDQLIGRTANCPNRSARAAAASSLATRFGGSAVQTCRSARGCAWSAQATPIWNWLSRRCDGYPLSSLARPACPCGKSRSTIVAERPAASIC